MQPRTFVSAAVMLGVVPFLASPVLGKTRLPQKSPGQSSTLSVAQPAKLDPAVSVIQHWVLGLSQATLDNGLRVVMAPDPSSPTVSVCVTYDVGSRNEDPGRSGFAHLFEHMMFQGSRNIGKGEHFQLVSARGGQLNGTTSSDRTNYFETLPASELALGLWLEADRMRWLDVTEANFENQRAVVKEEYRMRVENAAYRPALIELERQIFAGYGPYEHPTIGSMTDLDKAKFEWVREFHSKYYSPSNAVLSISGGFEADSAMALVREYFGPIEKGAKPSYIAPPPPPLPARERRIEVQDSNAKTPALLYGFRIPEARAPEHYALEMAARVLTDGESSRLYGLLVREKALARDVSAYTYDHRGPDAFVLTVELNDGVTTGTVEALIDAEIAQLAAGGPATESLERARQRTKSSFVFGLQSNQARATTLGEYAAFFNNPRLIARDLEALLSVTASDIAHSVQKYLSKDSRTIVTVKPVSSAPMPRGTAATSGPLSGKIFETNAELEQR